MTRPHPAQLSEREALRNFAESLTVAAEAARQLAYLQQRPHWLAVQNAMLGARKRALEMAHTTSSKLIMPPSIARMM